MSAGLRLALALIAQMRFEQRGFSLVENIISIGLLTGALVPLTQLAAMSVSTNALARHRTLAMIVAEQKIEQLRAEPSLSVAASMVEYVGEDGQPACATGTCGAGVYERRWSVLDVAGAPGAVLLHVVVRHARYADVHLVTVRPRKAR
jgi:Tfp pilus assembly protein PilV